MRRFNKAIKKRANKADQGDDTQIYRGRFKKVISWTISTGKKEKKNQ